MAFTRPSGGNGNKPGDSKPIERLGKGKFKMRLVAVANLGTYEDEYKGEVKINDKMALALEVIGKPVDFGEGERPRILWTKPFNFFSKLTEKGTELKHYSAFDEFAEEGEVPDWEAQLGKGVYGLVKAVVKGENTYDSLESLSPMDEDVEKTLPPAESELLIDNADDNEKLQGMFYGLVRYQYSQPRVERKAAKPAAKKGPAKRLELPTADDDDNLPF